MSAVLDDLRQAVLEANLALPRNGLVTLTWGNASGIDADRELVVIKPSGLPYAGMTAEDLVVVDLDGNIVEGKLRPSSDTPSHLALYRAFESIGGVVHTHSTWAASFAQAEREIPILGTTHADLAPLAIPVARRLSVAEIEGEYEANTGKTLIEAIGDHGTDKVPAALAAGHGPFTWGKDANDAVERAITLEEVARMALLTLVLRPDAEPLSNTLRDRHFSRKHGPGAYYGQKA